MKSVELQHEVQVFHRRLAPRQMRPPGRSLESRFVQIQNALRRMGAGDGDSFQDFVIQRDGQFRIREARTNDQPQLPPENPRPRKSSRISSIFQLAFPLASTPPRGEEHEVRGPRGR